MIAVGLLAPALAAAQVNVGQYGSTFGLGTADLQSTAIRVVQWVLGFLGLIAVIMIFYGVFGALTAGGDEDRVAFSKKVIVGAIIGLIVILVAWAIVTYVVSTTNQLTA